MSRLWSALSGCLLASWILPRLFAEPVPLQHAHAHNDYEHPRPLIDALAQGFTSVEADLYWIDGELRVAHDRNQARPGRTLSQLYLDPLKDCARTNGGRIHLQRAEFFLMLDYKAAGDAEVRELHQAVTNELQSYQKILTSFEGNQTTPRAVTIVLSGSRPAETVAKENPRWWALDGRPSDLTNRAPTNLVVWISTSWRPTFSWTGQGQFPEAQLRGLRTLIQQTHDRKRRLRFWGAPDHLAFWKTLHTEGVDLINTDKLEQLSTYLKSTPNP